MKTQLLLAILLLLSSCKNINNGNINKQVTDSSKVIIDISETIDVPEQLIDEYIDFIKIIPLETTTASAVSHIWSVRVGKQKIFIQDSYSKGNVAIFDKEGHFEKRLPFGQGPGEVIAPLSIKYNGTDNHLYVLDGDKSQILKYDESGNCVNNYPTMTFIVDFMPTPEGFLFIQGPMQNHDNEYYVFLNDTLGENINTWPLGKGYKNGTNYNNIYQIGEDFRFDKQLGNIIYSYCDKQIEEKYEIKYDNSEIDYSKYGDRPYDIEEDYPDAYILYNGIMETKNWLRIAIMSETKDSKSIYVNKKNNKRWSQDICLEPDYFTSWMDIIGVADAEKDIFVGVVEPEKLLHATPIYMEYGWNGSNPNNLISPEDMEKLKKVQPDDNPIIVLFKLKDEI